MNTLNLEQVKEHFKYAKEVRCLATKIIRNVKDLGKLGIYSNTGTIWASLKDGNYIKLYNPDTNQLAEILTYIFDRGEEIEVSGAGDIYHKLYFIGINKKGKLVCEDRNGTPCNYNYIRKLTPESLLEPQLSEFKKFAESKFNCTVTIIFEGK